MVPDPKGSGPGSHMYCPNTSQCLHGLTAGEWIQDIGIILQAQGGRMFWVMETSWMRHWGCQDPRITEVGNALPDHGDQAVTSPHQIPECHIPWIPPGMWTPPLECLTILSMEKILMMSREILLMSSGTAKLLLLLNPPKINGKKTAPFPRS